MLDNLFCSTWRTSGRRRTLYLMAVWIDADRLGVGEAGESLRRESATILRPYATQLGPSIQIQHRAGAGAAAAC